MQRLATLEIYCRVNRALDAVFSVVLDVIAPSCESLFSPFKRFSRDRCAFAVIDEAAIIRSGRAMFPYSASSAWPHACCAMVVGDEMIGRRVSGIGVGGRP